MELPVRDLMTVVMPLAFCEHGRDSTVMDGQMQEFDYIVVGAGTAGCVVASRLSADPAVTVLLLEAGAAPGIWSRIPVAFRYAIYRSGQTWPLQSEPEPQLNDRVTPLLAGRVLGGSSAINGMLYLRGQSRDFDAWAAMGCEGWDAASVSPYFERIERQWPLTNVQDPRLLQSDFARALNVAGFQEVVDPLRGDPDGYFPPRITVDARGRRRGSAGQYLPSALRGGNFQLVADAQVTGVTLEKDRATGVRWLQRGSEQQARARREVVLASGAYHTPKLLMLSGIGPASELSRHGIKVNVNLPGVGENLCNHSMVAMRFLASKPLPAMQALRLDRAALSMLAWGFLGRGLFAVQPTSQMLFLRSRGWLPHPDCQVTLGTLGIDADWWFPGIRSQVPDAFVAGITQLRPFSRGWVRLRSADPQNAPRILTNLLGDARDPATVIACMRIVREIFATEPLAQWTEREWRPGAAAQTDEQLAAALRSATMASGHPVGTCRMGSGSDAVVDPQLRVFGIDGLRVADASIMPSIPGAGTYATSIMIGEKAADMIAGRATAGGANVLSFPPRMRVGSARM